MHGKSELKLKYIQLRLLAFCLNERTYYEIKRTNYEITQWRLKLNSKLKNECIRQEVFLMNFDPPAWNARAGLNTRPWWSSWPVMRQEKQNAISCCVGPPSWCFGASTETNGNAWGRRPIRADFPKIPWKPFFPQICRQIRRKIDILANFPTDL